MRTDFGFDSDGTACAAWHYRPEATWPSPCVVMAHGLSGVREQRLDAYAERFAQAGMHVLLFDYRFFGASSGEPRQLVSVRHQTEDWEAAIKVARALPGVDPARIALFGTSFSGGHVQVLAARDGDIAAAIAQAPFCGGAGSPMPSASVGMRLMAASIRDIAGDLLGRDAHRIPAVGLPGTVAFMSSPDAVPGFAEMTPPDSTWRNEICARAMMEVGSYNPGRSASKIACPILYSIAEEDRVLSARAAHDTARRASRAEVKSYACGHFDVYMPPHWEQVVSDQVDFLTRHLALQ
jgi:dienelactone hydrolase